MSDQPVDSPSQAAAPDGGAGEISFDKAEYDSREAPVCLSCKKPINGSYYRLNGKPFCSRCHDAVLAHFERTLSGSQKLAGSVLVLGAVVGTSVGWYAIREATGYEVGLIAIGVAYVIAKALRRASGGLGGRRLQIAAVALTYLSIAGSNAPLIVKAMAHSQTDTGSPIFALAVLGLALSAPFLDVTRNFMGILIIGIALYEAWKLTAAVPLHWEGPLSYQPPEAAPGAVPTLAPESLGGG